MQLLQRVQRRLFLSDMIKQLLWGIVFISLCGNFLIINKNIIGFWLWVFADLFLMWYNFYINEIAQGILYLIYIIFCFYGIYHWNKKEK